MVSFVCKETHPVESSLKFTFTSFRSMLTSCQSPGASVNLICNVDVRDSLLQAINTTEKITASANANLNIFIDCGFEYETIENCAIYELIRKPSSVFEE